MTRKVEEILNLVANSEHYLPKVDSSGNHSGFMCYSLGYAKRSGLITEEERDLAAEAVAKYLRKLCAYSGLTYHKYSISLEEVLDGCRLPSSFKDRKTIYLDWTNRPKSWKGD